MSQRGENIFILFDRYLHCFHKKVVRVSTREHDSNLLKSAIKYNIETETF